MDNRKKSIKKHLKLAKKLARENGGRIPSLRTSLENIPTWNFKIEKLSEGKSSILSRIAEMKESTDSSGLNDYCSKCQKIISKDRLAYPDDNCGLWCKKCAEKG